MKFKEYLQETANTSQFLTNYDEIKAWLDEMEIKNYSIASDGKVSVKGYVKINNAQLTSIPVQFTEVTGFFNCSVNNLTSLTGCPTKVGDAFICSVNNLTSLVGCPSKVGGSFICSSNKLTSLVGCPSKVDGTFYCNENNLTSLAGCPPEVGGAFYCNDNKLTSLVGCPSKVNGNFCCSSNELVSLVGVSDFIESIEGSFSFPTLGIKTGGLELLLIKDIKNINADSSEPFDIIKKYIGHPDKIFECQEKLIKAGFEAYAQL